MLIPFFTNFWVSLGFEPPPFWLLRVISMGLVLAGALVLRRLIWRFVPALQSPFLQKLARPADFLILSLLILRWIPQLYQMIFIHLPLAPGLAPGLAPAQPPPGLAPSPPSLFWLRGLPALAALHFADQILRKLLLDADSPLSPRQLLQKPSLWALRMIGLGWLGFEILSRFLAHPFFSSWFFLALSAAVFYALIPTLRNAFEGLQVALNENWSVGDSVLLSYQGQSCQAKILSLSLTRVVVEIPGRTPRFGVPWTELNNCPQVISQ